MSPAYSTWWRIGRVAAAKLHAAHATRATAGASHGTAARRRNASNDPAAIIRQANGRITGR